MLIQLLIQRYSFTYPATYPLTCPCYPVTNLCLSSYVSMHIQLLIHAYPATYPCLSSHNSCYPATYPWIFQSYIREFWLSATCCLVLLLACNCVLGFIPQGRKLPRRVWLWPQLFAPLHRCPRHTGCRGAAGPGQYQLQ
jgi:hypothetical protein